MSVLPVAFALLALSAEGPKVEKLESGLPLLTIARGLVPLLYYRISVPLGSAFDPPGKSGLARLTTMVIEAGLERTPGVEIAAETGVTSSVFFGSAPADRADEALPAIIAAILHPPSSESATKNAIARLLDDRQKSNLDDRSLARREARRMIFGAHAYGRATMGEVRDIASITADDVQALVHRQLHAESMVLAVAEGPDGKGDLVSRAKKWTDDVPKGRASELDLGPAPSHGAHGRRIVLIDKPERRTAEICAAILVPGAIDPRRPAMAAALAAMGGSFSSRLIKTLDKKEKIALLPLASLEEQRSAGMLSIAFAAEHDKLTRAIRALFDELGALTKNPLTEEEMRFGRAYASARAQLELRDPRASLRSAVAAQVLGIEAVSPWALARSVEAATDDEVRAAAKLLFASDDMAIAVVASVTPKLQAELAALPGVKAVSIVSWEDR